MRTSKSDQAAYRIGRGRSYKKKEAGPGKAYENICGRYLSIIRMIWNHCKKYNSRTVILTVKKYEKHTYRPLIFSSTEV